MYMCEMYDFLTLARTRNEVGVIYSNVSSPRGSSCCFNYNLKNKHFFEDVKYQSDYNIHKVKKKHHKTNTDIFRKKEKFDLEKE